MDNNTPTVILELEGKFSDDVVDYIVDLSAYLSADASLENVTVEIDAAGNGESPPEMTVTDSQVYAIESGQPAQSVLFWLSGGTSGVRYRGAITFGDDQVIGSPTPTRQRTRWFYIVVS